MLKHAIRGKPALEIGSIVKIRKNLKGDDDYGGTYFNPQMEQYCNETAKVVGITSDGHYILDIDKIWIWSKEMLEQLF